MWKKVSVVGGRLTSNVTWTPTFRKLQLARKGLSQCEQNHNQHHVSRTEPVFLTVQDTIHTKMQCDNETLLEEADVSKKWNLMLVGGYVDITVDLCGEGNVDIYIHRHTGTQVCLDDTCIIYYRGT